LYAHLSWAARTTPTCSSDASAASCPITPQFPGGSRQGARTASCGRSLFTFQPGRAAPLQHHRLDQVRARPILAPLQERSPGCLATPVRDQLTSHTTCPPVSTGQLSERASRACFRWVGLRAPCLQSLHERYTGPLLLLAVPGRGLVVLGSYRLLLHG